MEADTLEKEEITILFAGDSGDGIQLIGGQFTNTSALFGNDISTFPNFPAEIRAPQGTLAGVSGFQLQFGSIELYTAGDDCDALVVMNAAALEANIKNLKIGGTIIANLAGFDKKNLRLAGIENGENPLENEKLTDYKIIEVDITKLTREALKETELGTKEQNRSKNMFVLGLLYWMYNRKLDSTLSFINTKFKNKPEIAAANCDVLKAGYHYGEISEVFTSRYNVKAATLKKGQYRNITGNQATAIGLVAASQKSDLQLFYGSYPITPASDILHELAKHKKFGVKTFQAEDEIAAICSAIGSSFSGGLGATASSGPGIALKGEAIGLAVVLELPLVIINVQRGGPSTGLPTKTEQSDLFQALYGRNGEAPVPVIAASTPSDCFDAIYEATRIAIEHMTPVLFLSDGYIANGSEPWLFPKAKDLIPITKKEPQLAEGETFLPYKRNEDLVRSWGIPGTPNLEHRIGGLEKQVDTGNVSYDPENHEQMVKIRAEKIQKIAHSIPVAQLEVGTTSDEILILGWGSTFGVIKTAVNELRKRGYKVAQLHLRYINPLPLQLGEIINSFNHVIIPEMNDGQLQNLLQAKFVKELIPLNKIEGMPFTTKEIIEKATALLAV